MQLCIVNRCQIITRPSYTNHCIVPEYLDIELLYYIFPVTNSRYLYVFGNSFAILLISTTTDEISQFIQNVKTLILFYNYD